eukprot:3004366-Amphidinium_carterae.2
MDAADHKNPVHCPLFVSIGHLAKRDECVGDLSHPFNVVKVASMGAASCSLANADWFASTYPISASADWKKSSRASRCGGTATGRFAKVLRMCAAPRVSGPR